MPVESKSRNKEVVAILVMTAVLLGVYALWQSRFVQDIWRGWRYEATAEVSEIKTELELTEKGERIFLATWPAVEDAESFNEHCNSHKTEVSLLGCYVGGNIYIYNIKLDSLKDSNKVTAAHELLHAVWERMGVGERERVEKMLDEVKKKNEEWVEMELDLYGDDERIEELYTRAGTKLRDLPEELEEHYSEYFRDRAKIVEFYENYQAPFNELKTRNEELKKEVEALGKEIEREREEYNQGMAELKQEVEEFNRCAETEGCFRSEAQFRRRRVELENKEKELEAFRIVLNEKIERNNQAVEEYQENARSLGELSNAMNSNITKVE